MHNFKCCYLNYYIVIFVIINISILLLWVEYRYYFYLNFVSYRYTITHFLVAKDLFSITFEIARHLQEQHKWRNWSRIFKIILIAVKYLLRSFFLFFFFLLYSNIPQGKPQGSEDWQTNPTLLYLHHRHIHHHIIELK